MNWTGSDIHLAHVGEHSIQCTVTRLVPNLASATGNELVTECWEMPFVIHDVNECELPPDHEMAHQCHPSSICVNAVGTYHCQCAKILADDDDDDEKKQSNADNAWNLAISTTLLRLQNGSTAGTISSSCAGRSTTEGCCPRDASADPNDCRANFRCPTDPCRRSETTNEIISQLHQASKCDALAACTRNDTPPGYTCTCPPNTIGTGHTCSGSDASLDADASKKIIPKIRADGRATPETLEHIRNMQICGCPTPELDPCSDYTCTEPHTVCSVTSSSNTNTNTKGEAALLLPSCTCIPGYIRTEAHGCVDPSPPNLALLCDANGDHTTRLKQGQTYHECLIQIIHNNNNNNNSINNNNNSSSRIIKED